jgi:hypothetical protein
MAGIVLSGLLISVLDVFKLSPIAKLCKSIKKYARKFWRLWHSREKYIFDYALQSDPERSLTSSGIDTGSMSEIVPPRK